MALTAAPLFYIRIGMKRLGAHFNLDTIAATAIHQPSDTIRDARHRLIFHELFKMSVCLLDCIG